MGRIALLFVCGLMVAAASPLSAELIEEYEDFVFLHDHETVRYRVEIDYGTASEVDVDLYVRGIYEPPRVRVMEGDRDEVKDVRDRNGDYILDFDFTAKVDADHTYYVEVDCASPWDASEFDVFIEVYAPAGSGAAANVRFDKFYTDYETGDDSDHYDCSTGADDGGWPLVMLGAGVIGAVWFRQRRGQAHGLTR